MDLYPDIMGMYIYVYDISGSFRIYNIYIFIYLSIDLYYILYLSIDLYDPDISRFVTSLDPIWRNEALGHVNAKDKRITWPPISLWHHLIDYKDI